MDLEELLEEKLEKAIDGLRRSGYPDEILEELRRIVAQENKEKANNERKRTVDLVSQRWGDIFRTANTLLESKKEEREKALMDDIRRGEEEIKRKKNELASIRRQRRIPELEELKRSTEEKGKKKSKKRKKK